MWKLQVVLIILEFEYYLYLLVIYYLYSIINQFIEISYDINSNHYIELSY